MTNFCGFNSKQIALLMSFAQLSYRGNTSRVLRANKSKTEEELKHAGYKIEYIEDFGTSMRCAIASSSKHVIIAFRGTESTQNLYTDLDLGLVKHEVLRGKVHKGFHMVFSSIWPHIVKLIKSKGSKATYDLTGHSMGGGIAKIAAWYMYAHWKIKPRVLTIGAPCVFDEEQAKNYNARLGNRTLRIVQYRKDIIATIAPKFLGYAHVGSELRIPMRGLPHKLLGYKHGVERFFMISTRNRTSSIYDSMLTTCRVWYEKCSRFMPQAKVSVRT